jgi:hypothetical protein
VDSLLQPVNFVGVDAILVRDDGALLGLDQPALHLLPAGGTRQSHTCLATGWASRAKRCRRFWPLLAGVPSHTGCLQGRLPTVEPRWPPSSEVVAAPAWPRPGTPGAVWNKLGRVRSTSRAAAPPPRRPRVGVAAPPP